MSQVRNRAFVSRGVRPAQVFKKRNNVWNTTIANGSNAVLLSEIVLRETGTIYSVKIGYNAHHAGAAANLNLTKS